MLHKKILYVYMSGVCHWDTYNNISQYANILKAKLSSHLIWKNCTESKISPLALRSSTRRASSSSDINFENKLNETEEEAFHKEGIYQSKTSPYLQFHHIGKGPATKSDEFSEKLQTTFDPPTQFRKFILQFFYEMHAHDFQR